MDKKQLRSIYKEKRSLLSQAEIQNLSRQIFVQLQANFNLKQKTIHLFSSIEKFNEINTSDWLQDLYKLDSTIVTSIMEYSPLSLRHSIITEETKYKPDSFGIPTPTSIIPLSETEIDIVIIPLLAYDKKGNRVGYGKGIYDRFLNLCKPDVIKIGVSFFDPTEKISDSNNFDSKLHYCITPSRIYSFDEPK